MKLVLALAALLQAMPADTTDAPFTATLAPGVRYDPAIPTLMQVAGHDFDEEITPPADIVRYLEALADAAPDRARLFEYARSFEGRPLVMLVIGNSARIDQLEDVKEDLRRLADPRGLDDAEAERLVADLPAVVALVYGVHGNEITSAGAAMAGAYHLLAAQNDPRVDDILANALVLVDPAQNPDGRARFVAGMVQDRGRWASPEPISAEHDEGWPGGRTNHYLFDLNRDWFAQSQPESRGRVAALLEYMPHVVVDLHEMSGNATYYFPPNAVPGNTWTTDAQTALLNRFGARTADAFDERGFAYFNRDTYDAFYPGYGVSWPMATGALGMTFEQASPRGLLYQRSDGDLLTYGDGILHHFTSALATTHTAAVLREELLREYLEFRRSAVELGREGGYQGAREYVLHSAHDPGMARRLAETLALNGIDVGRAVEPVRVGGRTLPAEGTYVVPLEQPSHRLLRNLLDPHTPMDADFVAEQVRRRAQRLPDQIYDVTAWSLPLLWDVELVPAREPTGAATVPVSADDVAAVGDPVALSAADAEPAAALPAARVGYLIPWGTSAASAVTEALRLDVRVRSIGGELTLAGRRYAVGTALVRASENGHITDLAGLMTHLAERHGVEIVPVDDSYVEEGTSLGARSVRALRLPRVLLAYGSPGSSYSVGWARYVLEQRYGVPVTAVPPDNLGRAELSAWDVIVLPSGSYGSILSGDALRRLREWMSTGGTLITMAQSSVWASGAGLLATGTEVRGGALASEAESSRDRTPEQPIDLLEAIAPDIEPPEQTPGAIVNTILDTGHWLASGTDGEIGVLVEGTRVFRPITLDEGTNVGVYAPLDRLVAGGIVWDEAQPQLANKAFLIYQGMGQGQLVAFAEDPNYRAYAEATELLFVNAVLLGPGR